MPAKITFETIKEPLGRVLRIINKDRSKFKPRVINPRKIINAETLEQAAGSHMFDDLYYLYGITEDEGHEIRAYFESTGRGNRKWKDYIEVLHKEFPDYIDIEETWYIESANEERKKRGEPLIVINDR